MAAAARQAPQTEAKVLTAVQRVQHIHSRPDLVRFKLEERTNATG